MSSSQSTGFMPIPNWWVTHPHINSQRLSVLIALAKFADRDTHTCFPAQGTIAEMLNISRALVNKIIGQLVELGIIEKTYRRRENHGTTSCLYKLPLAGTSVSSARTDSNSSKSKSVTGGVKDSDRNKTKNNKSLSKLDQNEIREWVPSSDVLQKMKSITLDFDPAKYAMRFKEKVLSKGYSYTNLDQTVIEWFKSDHERGLFKAKKSGARSKGHHSVSSASQPAKIEPLTAEFLSETGGEKEVQAKKSALKGEALPQDATDQDRFKAAMVLLGRHKGKSFYACWLSSLSLSKFDGETLHISAKDKFTLDYALSKCEGDILEACSSAGILARRVRG